MDNEKIFELMTEMYADLKQGQEKIYIDLKTEIEEVKKTVIKIEDEHGKKLNALFDGYKQNSEKLQRIEDEVSKHEEVIIRRVK